MPLASDLLHRGRDGGPGQAQWDTAGPPLHIQRLAPSVPGIHVDSSVTHPFTTKIISDLQDATINDIDRGIARAVAPSVGQCFVRRQLPKQHFLYAANDLCSMSQARKKVKQSDASARMLERSVLEWLRGRTH
jgi:hypothetical protein